MRHPLIGSLALTALVLLPAAATMGQAATQPTLPPPDAKPAEKLVYVLMTTSHGDIVLELNRAEAPLSVENFLKYADAKFYDNTIFHRVIRGRIVQGGGYEPGLVAKETRPPIKCEWPNGLKNTRGTIAMARKPQPDTATSQFYINVRDNLGLDRPISGGAGYVVFGRVVAGMSVVDAIQAEPTGPKKGMRDVPIKTVTLEKVRTITAEDAKKRIEADKKKGPTTRPG
jgi:peptidyl-prolyl cis-trans isomerase A (cyclophilin A)